MEHITWRYYFLKHVFVFLLIGLLVSSCVATKFHVGKTELHQYFSINDILKESLSGLAVYDVDTDSMIFSYNADKRFIPASNMKLFTYYAALEMLKDSIPSMEFCIVGDTIFFTGTGDPTWYYEEFNHVKSISILSDSACNLIYVPRTMADKRFGSGWAWDDYLYSFSVEKSTFPIYGNRISLTKPSDSESMKVIPKSMEILINKTSVPAISDNEIFRSEFSNDFYLDTDSNLGTVDAMVPFIYSDELFINLLADTLNRPIYVAGLIPECDLMKVYDSSIDSVISEILLESDNFMSEQLLLVISSYLGNTLSSQKVIELIGQNQLADIYDEISWVDGSGLSRYNLLTPSSIIFVLKKILSRQPKEKIYSMLPESGKTGTLANSFIGLAGNIHAKSGSMSGVYNLSGYLVTNSGKTLAFSFMNNNFMVSPSLIRQEMEKVLSAFMEY